MNGRRKGVAGSLENLARASASTFESPPPSTSPSFFFFFDEEDPLSQPKGNIATSSSEPKARECHASPASNSEDVPEMGYQ